MDLSPEMVVAGRHLLWRQGDLRWKLDPDQRMLLRRMEALWDRRIDPSLTGAARVEAIPPISFFLNCRRGFGKSFALVIYCFELALRTSGRVITYAAPLKKDATKIFTLISQNFMDDCPDDVRDRIIFDPHKSTVRFVHDGAADSMIYMEGVDNGAWDTLRGPGAHLIVLDECAFMPDLAYGLRSICVPIAERWGGRIILATTPPRVPNDTEMIFSDHRDVDAAITLTLNDGVRDSWDRKARLLKEWRESPEDIPKILAGEMLPRKPEARREGYCLWETDASQLYVPEWQAHKHALTVVTPEGDGFDRYESMDPGFTDHTGVLFAAFDPYRAVLMVEDELLLKQPSAILIAESIRAKELVRWAGGKPRRRVSDIDKFLIDTLYREHGLAFDQAEKRDSLASLTLLRDLIDKRQIEIHPRCSHLLDQLDRARWNKRASDLDRDPKGGHFDLVAAMKYLVRAVDFARTRSRNASAERRMERTKPRWSLYVKSTFTDALAEQVDRIWRSM